MSTNQKVYDYEEMIKETFELSSGSKMAFLSNSSKIDSLRKYTATPLASLLILNYKHNCISHLNLDLKHGLSIICLKKSYCLEREKNNTVRPSLSLSCMTKIMSLVI